MRASMVVARTQTPDQDLDTKHQELEMELKKAGLASYKE